MKENQPQLRADIAFWFEYEHGLRREDPPDIHAADKGHGRLVTSTLQRTAALNDYLKWPGLGQVFRLTQQSTNLKTGATSSKSYYGLTSLSLAQASGSALLRLWREHWHIENSVHWVRDAIFAEDHSRARKGSLPHVLAALRNLLLNALRLYGYPLIKQARTAFSANLNHAFGFVGIT